jgi:hypothetical protein
MRKNEYKLICYRGHDPEDQFELYDMETDPEELVDLYPSRPAFVSEMRDELFSAIHQSDQRIAE